MSNRASEQAELAPNSSHWISIANSEKTNAAFLVSRRLRRFARMREAELQIILGSPTMHVSGAQS
jgi:hypothetical protein